MQIIYRGISIYIIALIFCNSVYADSAIEYQIEQEHKQRLANMLLYSKELKAQKSCYMTYLTSNADGEFITERQAKSNTGFITEIVPTETKLSFKHKNIKSRKLSEFDVPFRRQLLKTPDGNISENLDGKGMLHDMYTDAFENKIIQYLIPVEAKNLLYFKMLRLSYEKNNSNNSVISLYECYN